MRPGVADPLRMPRSEIVSRVNADHRYWTEVAVFRLDGELLATPAVRALLTDMDLLAVAHSHRINASWPTGASRHRCGAPASMEVLDACSSYNLLKGVASPTASITNPRPHVLPCAATNSSAYHIGIPTKWMKLPTSIR